MTDNKELLDRLDDEIMSSVPALGYAQEHTEQIIDSAYQNCVRRVFTTRADSLGIACPSLVNHRVIGGSKRGRVIKTIPQNGDYCEIGYDHEDNPLYFKDINTFGTEQTYFFFYYEGAVWVMEMELIAKNKPHRRVRSFNMKKYYYDEKGRIKFYAEIESYGFIIANLYEYPEDAEKPIVCHFYYYVTDLSESSEAVNKRQSRVQFYEHLYEITPDLKIITEYNKNDDGEYVFSRQLVSGNKRSAKPKAAADSFRRFSEWLDSELEKKIPTSGGVYFDLFEPTEDGFGIYFCITDSFDADDDDWACEIEYSSDNMHMVHTSGELEWEAALDTAVKLIRKYLREGKYKSVLRKYDGIGTSFSDGDIEYIYVKKKR